MSTSNSQPRAYHHGDLRKALVEAALTLLEGETAEELSLRQVARTVGVSPAAVYRHFPDKQALMEAVAAQGLARLGAAQAAAAAGVTSEREAFSATGRAYVRFAIDNPALFRATFSYPGLELNDVTQDEAGKLLYANARRLAGGDELKAQVIAVRAWSLAHGMAVLILDGRLPDDAAMIDATMDAAALA